MWVTASVRCAPPANRPTPDERDRCFPFLLRELALLERVRVVVALGQFGYDVVARALQIKGRPRFGHGAVHGPLLGCYHPSQQNTFTGRLTEAMTDAILLRARSLAALDPD